MSQVYKIVIALMLVSASVKAGEGTKLVEQFVNAFNQKDIETMLALSGFRYEMDERGW